MIERRGNMDPSVITSYLESAEYRRAQAEQTRVGYEQEAQQHAEQAADYESRAQTYRKSAEDAQYNATSYLEEEQSAIRDIEYYSNQMRLAQEQADRERQAAQAYY